jgi:hypothetical protein
LGDSKEILGCINASDFCSALGGQLRSQTGSATYIEIVCLRVHLKTLKHSIIDTASYWFL